MDGIMHVPAQFRLAILPSGVTVYLQTMRILLQHARTLLYFKGLGAWTSSPYEALDFLHSQRAIDFARRHGLVGVQIAVKFVECESGEVVPLPPLVPAHAFARQTFL